MQTSGTGDLRTVFVAGLDLGQAADFTAFVLNRVRWRFPDAAPRQTSLRQLAAYHDLLYVKRWPLRTSYVQIAADLKGLLSRPPMTYPRLAVDETGVGRAVVDIFRRERLPCYLHPVLITGGHETTSKNGSWHVPKKELAAVLRAAAQQRRIQVAECPVRQTLLNEFEAFKIKVSLAGNETFEAWREKDHDDLVLAAALACWLGERCGLPAMPATGGGFGEGIANYNPAVLGRPDPTTIRWER